MWNAEWKRDPRARRASINFAFRIPHSALEVSMPSPLVECVPNFSEGRNAATIEALRLALTSVPGVRLLDVQDRKSTRLNSSHLVISYAVFCLKKKKTTQF